MSFLFGGSEIRLAQRHVATPYPGNRYVNRRQFPLTVLSTPAKLIFVTAITIRAPSTKPKAHSQPDRPSDLRFLRQQS
jgi:hypothetical protein